MYKVLVWVARVICRYLMYLTVEGKENIPSEGPFIVVFNHVAFLESAALLATIPFEMMAFIAHVYHRNIFLVPLRKYIIFVHRKTLDRQALREAIQRLEDGGVLIISPEGMMTGGALVRGKPGVAYIATKANVPVLPLGIAGAEIIFRKWARFHRPEIVIRVGKPFTLTSDNSNIRRSEVLQRVVDTQVMPAIRNLLPARYHGYYAKPT